MKKYILFLTFLAFGSNIYASPVSQIDSIMNSISSKFQKDTTGTRIFNSGDFKIIEIDLPGFGKENILSRIENGNIIVFAKYNNKDSNQSLSKTYQNSIYIGDVSAIDIISEYKDGVLTFKIPLSKIKSDKSEKIEIK